MRSVRAYQACARRIAVGCVISYKNATLAIKRNNRIINDRKILVGNSAVLGYGVYKSVDGVITRNLGFRKPLQC